MAASLQPFNDADEDVRKFYEVLSSETNDVACILLSTAFLDHCLKLILRKFMVSGDTAKGLLKHSGSLGNFEARAELVYCLGLIPKGLLNNLRALGKMRNEFAHTHLTKSFADPDVGSVVDSLQLPTVKGKSLVVPSGAAVEYTTWPAHFFTSKRLAFVFIMAMIGSDLRAVLAEIESRTKKPDKWTNPQPRQ